DTRYDGVTYQCRFQSKKEEWIVIHLPFKDFIPTHHGRVLTGTPPLDPRKIKTIGFLISEKQDGSFKLEMGWIKSYKRGK
ncbi:MAG: CIA30 family protein, partial [bacterium]